MRVPARIFSLNDDSDSLKLRLLTPGSFAAERPISRDSGRPATVVIGGRLPRLLAERIVASIRSPDDAFQPRRGIGLPSTKIMPADVTSLSAAVGAAAIPLRAGYFN